MIEDSYHPIDCTLHDKLENLATRRSRVAIVFDDAAGELRQLDDVIRDWNRA